MAGLAIALGTALIIRWSGLLWGTTAQPPEPAFRDRVVDAVLLKDDLRLDGFVLHDNPLSVLLRVDWLQRHYPGFYESEIRPLLAAADVKPGLDLAELLDTEAAAMRMPPASDPARAAMLSELASHLRTAVLDPPALIQLEIPRERIKRVDKQPNVRREIGRLALLNRIADFESRSHKAVAADIRTIPPENLRTSPPADVSAAEQLPGILAAVDVQAGAALRLVRHGDLILDESGQRDAAHLIAQLTASQLQQSLTALLGDPELPTGGSPPQNRNRLPETATRMAEEAGVRTVVLSEFAFDLTAGMASVSRRLFRKAGQEWTLVMSAEGRASSAEVDSEKPAALADDPQVKSILDSFRAVGVDQARLTSALQMGAVVEKALKLAEAAFQDSILQATSVSRMNAASRPVEVRLLRTPNQPD